MKSQPAKKGGKKDKSKKDKSSPGLIINAQCFKAGRLYRAMLSPGAKVKVLSEDEGLVAFGKGKDRVEIRIRCGCTDPSGHGGGCRLVVDDPPWIYCSETVCQYCDMAISSRDHAF